MENEATTTEKAPTLTQVVAQWFASIDWPQCFSSLMWRILLIPALLLIIVAFCICFVANIVIWFVAGKSYFYEIDRSMETYVRFVWNKAFPDA